LRVVFDTNVLVSAVLFRSSQPAIAVRQILQGETLLISQAIFEEWHEVLSRPILSSRAIEIY
jgi:predicted nucleic acid-binding protein